MSEANGYRKQTCGCTRPDSIQDHAISLSLERYAVVMSPDLQQIVEFWKINHYEKFLKDFKEWVKKVICLERPAQRFLDLFTVPVNHLLGQTFKKLPHKLC